MPQLTSASRRAPMYARAFSDLRFTKSHEWVRMDGDHAVIGISEYAGEQLGEVVYCELPEVGATFSKKESIVTLESVKAVGEVYAPMDCEVVETNGKLADESNLVNEKVETGAWLVKVKPTGEVTDLMDLVAYKKHLETEVE